MNAPAATPVRPKPPKSLDLQTLFSWLLADGIVEKSTVKPHFAQAQGILKNAVGAMHPLTAIAQCKIVSAKAPHKLLTLGLCHLLHFIGLALFFRNFAIGLRRHQRCWR